MDKDTIQLLDKWRSIAEYLEAETPLTQRQSEVLVLRDGGWPTEVTCEQLDIAENTVSRHLTEANNRIGGARELIEAVEGVGVCRPVASESLDDVTFTLYDGVRRRQSETRLSKVEETQWSQTDEFGVDRSEQHHWVSSKDAAIERFTQGELFDGFVEGAVVYNLLNDWFDGFPPLDEVYADDPPSEEVQRALSDSHISREQAKHYLEDATDTYSASNLVLGSTLGTELPVTYPITPNSVHLATGAIGSGKTFTTQLLMRRFHEQDDNHTTICFVSPFDESSEFVKRLSGCTIENIGGVSEMSELGSYIAFQCEGSDYNSEAHAFGEAVLEKSETTDQQVVFVFDEAHALSPDTISMFCEQARTASNVYSTVFLAQSLDDLDSVQEAFELDMEDGIIAFRTYEVGPLLSALNIAPEHLQFVQTAATGKEQEYVEALASPPAQRNWTPTQIAPRPAELGLFEEQ